MQNIEIEYKVLVSQKDLDKLKEYFNNNQFQYKYYEQVNTYFDTVDFKLKTKKVSLRIRNIENENKYLLTLKEKAKEGRLETDFIVKDNQKSSIPTQIIQTIESYGFNFEEVNEIAKLKTIRYEYKYNNCLICLDYNYYYGKEDFEIECEASSMELAKSIIEKLLEKLNISYCRAQYPKTIRAIKSKTA